MAVHGNFYYGILENKYESINPVSSLHSWISFSLSIFVIKNILAMCEFSMVSSVELKETHILTS